MMTSLSTQHADMLKQPYVSTDQVGTLLAGPVRAFVESYIWMVVKIMVPPWVPYIVGAVLE